MKRAAPVPTPLHPAALTHTSCAEAAALPGDPRSLTVPLMPFVSSTRRVRMSTRESVELPRLRTQRYPAPAETGPGFSSTRMASTTDPVRGSMTATASAGTLTACADPDRLASATAPRGERREDGDAQQGPRAPRAARRPGAAAAARAEARRGGPSYSRWRSAKPLSVTRPRSRNPASVIVPTSWRTVSVVRISPPSARSITRAARLIAAPNSSPPPSSTSPALRPIRTRIACSRSVSSRWIDRAHDTAARGESKTTRNPSPVERTSRPPYAATCSRTIALWVASNAAAASSPSRVVMSVDASTSVNMTVAIPLVRCSFMAPLRATLAQPGRQRQRRAPRAAAASRSPGPRPAPGRSAPRSARRPSRPSARSRRGRRSRGPRGRR